MDAYSKSPVPFVNISISGFLLGLEKFLLFHLLAQELAKFSAKGQVTNVLGFVGYVVCPNYSTLLLQCKGRHKHMQRVGHGGIPIKLYLQKQTVGWIWPVALSF